MAGTSSPFQTYETKRKVAVEKIRDQFAESGHINPLPADVIQEKNQQQMFLLCNTTE